MKNKYRPKYQLGKNNSESTSLGVNYYDPKLIADMDFLRKVKGQPTIGKSKEQDDYTKKVNSIKKKNAVKMLPNAQMNGEDILPINPDRTLSGQALPNTRAARNDKFLEHAQGAMDAAGLLMGAGALKPLLSEALDRIGAKMFRPRLSSAVDDLGYHTIDNKGRQMYQLSDDEFAKAQREIYDATKRDPSILKDGLNKDITPDQLLERKRLKDLFKKLDEEETLKNNKISPEEYRKYLENSKKPIRTFPKTLSLEEEDLAWKERFMEQDKLQLESEIGPEWKTSYLSPESNALDQIKRQNYLQVSPYTASGHTVENGPRFMHEIMKNYGIDDVGKEFSSIIKKLGLDPKNSKDVEKYIQIFNKQQAAVPLEQLNIPYGRDLLRGIGSRYNEKGGLIKAQLGLNGTPLQGVRRQGNYLWSNPVPIDTPYPKVKFEDTGIQIPDEIQNDLISEDRWSMIPGFDSFSQRMNPNNPIQKGRTAVGQATTRTPEKEKQEPFNPYFMLRGATTGLSWLANKKSQDRQNQYMYNQYSTLGQMNPANIEDFQPNYYSLYAKFGGQLKKGGLTPNKAREILHDKTAHGHPLTDKQRRFFGAMSKGNTLKY